MAVLCGVVAVHRVVSEEATAACSFRAEALRLAEGRAAAELLSLVSFRVAWQLVLFVFQIPFFLSHHRIFI